MGKTRTSENTNIYFYLFIKMTMCLKQYWTIEMIAWFVRQLSDRTNLCKLGIGIKTTFN